MFNRVPQYAKGTQNIENILIMQCILLWFAIHGNGSFHSKNGVITQPHIRPFRRLSNYIDSLLYGSQQLFQCFRYHTITILNYSDINLYCNVYFGIYLPVQLRKLSRPCSPPSLWGRLGTLPFTFSYKIYIKSWS